MIVNFTTYLDACNIVAGDFVRVRLLDLLQFQDSKELGTLMFPVAGDSLVHLPNAIGFVEELTIDPSEWKVSVSVRLPIIMGTERDE